MREGNMNKLKVVNKEIETCDQWGRRNSRARAINNMSLDQLAYFLQSCDTKQNFSSMSIKEIVEWLEEDCGSTIDNI